MPIIKILNFTNANEKHEFNGTVDATIYDSLESQGFELPHGCLAGSCGACRIEIIEGAENLKTPSAVESDTIDHIKKNLVNNPSKNIRLSCRAKIIGDITISKL